MTTTPSARAREAAQDYFEVTNRAYFAQMKLGVTTPAIDRLVQAFARFEAEIRDDQMKRDAGVAEGEYGPCGCMFAHSQCQDSDVANEALRIATAIRENRP